MAGSNSTVGKSGGTGIPGPVLSLAKEISVFSSKLFNGSYYAKGYIERLRKCYNKVTLEMKEVIKGILIGTAFTVAITVVLVGSNFAGLSGTEKKELKVIIKNAEDSVDAMKIARKNLLKFKSSFETGVENTK